VIGDDGDAFLGVATVIDEDADQQATRLSFANADRQVLVELCEPAGER
jgi:hypothetical protein